MNEEFTEYLVKIGATGPIIAKVEYICKICEYLCPDEIKEIYISEYILENGDRVYENLWFFSKKHCMELHNFTQKEYFDLTPIEKNVTRIIVDKENYDFEYSANTQSRMMLNFSLCNGEKCSLKASKENCDYLLKIIKSYIIPNLNI